MLYLRSVTLADMDLMFQWANDEDVRNNAFDSKRIKYSDHIEWFKSKYDDDKCEIYILMNNDIPVGQIRLDFDGAEAYIDYSIQKDLRKKGYGSQIFKLLENEIINTHRNIVLVGLVKKNNNASCNRFIKLGFTIKEQPDYYEFWKEIKGADA